jgi:hypothetical protein
MYKGGATIFDPPVIPPGANIAVLIISNLAQVTDNDATNLVVEALLYDV